MVVNLRPLRDDLTNVEWLNAVRNEAGYDYQRRVPEATQANVQTVIQNLFNYKPLMNQFIDALVNRIGLVIFQNTIWTNPLAKFKRGTLEYGETIEEIMAGLLEATAYDADRDELEKEVFGAMTPEVQASYHTVNRRDRYKLTIKEPLLRNAFLTSNGLGEFITNLMSMPQTSDQWDEYLLMSNLFKEFDMAGGFFNIQVPDVSDQSSDSAESRFLLRRMRELSNTLPFISRLYNPAGMPVAARPEDLELFVTATAEAAMDVEALAAAFNIGKAEFGGRRTVMPVEHFGIPGVQAIITTRNFFVVADQRIDTTAIQNPAALFTNYWLHHWEVISASRFVPVVMFNSERASTVISVNETPVSSIGPIDFFDSEGVAATKLNRGELYNVTVNAVTTPAGGFNDAVRYTLRDKRSVFTRITNGGSLYIGPDESLDVIFVDVYAVDTYPPQITASDSLPVVGDQIQPWPNPDVLEDADKDGIPEVQPPEPFFNEETDTVTIPNVRGVQYRKAGANVNNGTTHVVSASTVFDAIARTGYELTPGTYSWTFDPA